MKNFMVGSEDELRGSDEKLYGYRNQFHSQMKNCMVPGINSAVK